MDLDKFTAVYIDDEPVNLMLVEAYGNEFGLKIKCFQDSKEGLDYILNHDVDIVYTDYNMPDINGLEIIKKYRQKSATVPIVVLTSSGDNQVIKINSLEAGATDFLSKPIDITEFKARSMNLLTLRSSQLKLQDRALLLEDEVRKATEVIQNREYDTLKVLGRTAEYKDVETANHTLRVAHYSKMLAKKVGLDERTQEIIFYAAPFHDLGKIGISDDILLKQGKLDDEEFVTMKKHVWIGYDILKDNSSPYLQEGAIIALNHHEKFDGSGYPNNLKGHDIPISARIVSIADVFDALSTTRPYKKPWQIDDVIELFKEQKGKHFDPELVDLFLGSMSEIDEIHTKFQ